MPPLRPFLGALIPSRRRVYSSLKGIVPARVLEDIDVVNFDRETPQVLRSQFRDIPAIKKWIKPQLDGTPYDELNSSYLEPYGSTLVPLELTRSQSPSHEPSSFERFHAPLSLLLSYMEGPQDPSTRLYLAQCPLEDLPSQLRPDLPRPHLISQLGKGDIYGSSLWAGRAPTMTPLHRDPNPNLFVQLAGTKVVRLMGPDAGRRLYDRVREGSGHANLRGEEMMVGEEAQRLEDAVWGEGADMHGVEAVLESGDGLYIPLGWWHSVAGVGKGVNVSVSGRLEQILKKTMSLTRDV